MNRTAINWTDLTWNPFSGCKKVSPECARCYAETLAEDKTGTRAFPHGFALTPRPHKLSEPERVAVPSLIFCNSMSDPGLSDEELVREERERLVAAGWPGTDAMRDAFFDAIEAAPRHRYQVLTKRPGRVLAYLRSRGRKLPPWVWMGVTIGSSKTTSRLDELRRFRDLGARVLFVSAEPLLGELALELRGVDWLITGGESGRHAADAAELERRFLVEREAPEELASARRRGEKRLAWRPRADRAGWLRRLRDVAGEAGCAHWFKQWGGPKPSSAGRVLDGRTWDEMPVSVSGAMPESRRIRLPIAA